MKTKNRFITGFLLISLNILIWACAKDDSIEPIGIDPCRENPCGNKERCPDACDTDNGDSKPGGAIITKDNFSTNATVIDTENGFIVDGPLEMKTDSVGTVTFDNADLEVEFYEDGSLKSMEGTSEVPEPSEYFKFEKPIQADVGFYSGQYLNQNFDFEILLEDDRNYFIYTIGATVELRIGVNGDPEAHKPFSIQPPVGGHITLIADYADPMYFFSVGLDALGSVSVGASQNGNIPFVPTLPVDDIVSFGAKSVKGGTFSFWKILEATGVYYENIGLTANANFEEPMESDIGYGYRAGINGELEMSLPITHFTTFTLPIGKGSAAFIAEASAQNGINSKAFINGLVAPDLSWWPNFLPVEPSGKLSAHGYLEQTGTFDIGVSGIFGLQTPTGTQSVEGSLSATDKAFTMAGKVIINSEEWGAEAVFTNEETKFIALAPNNFSEGISETVTEQIDEAIATTEQAYADLEKANERYNLELSLRGLRAALPVIMDRANSEIDQAVASGVASGRSQANKILADYGRILCSDNIRSQVNSLVKPYKDALTRIKNAVNNSNDNEQTRRELEAALLHLAGLNRIDRSIKVSVTHADSFFGCSWFPRTDTRTIKINRVVIPQDYVSQLREAASYVKYISEADGMRFDAQLIVDQLPTLEELEALKGNVEACVKELSEGVGGSGFVYTHETGEFSLFVYINGEEVQVDDFDIFSSEQLIETARFETVACNADTELKKLMDKNRK